jgi:hypothetical protein
MAGAAAKQQRLDVSRKAVYENRAYNIVIPPFVLSQ